MQIGFDGYDIGGVSVGESEPEMMAAVEAAGSADADVAEFHALSGIRLQADVARRLRRAR
jgi:queuine/archaeosine tRNA-ribosyltransferase